MADHVVVVGAGAAGISAALAAARAGASVTLLERRHAPGGIVVHALIHTLGGLYDIRGEYINTGLPQELAERLALYAPSSRRRRIGRLWTLAVSPEEYATVVCAWLKEESAITLITAVRDVTLQAGDSGVNSVRYHVAGRSETIGNINAVVDATGDASAIRTIDARMVEGSADDALSGCILRVRGVQPKALEFPRGAVLRRAVISAVQSGTLPDACIHTWFDIGQHDDEIFVKLSVSGSGSEDASGAVPQSTIVCLMEFLHQQPLFADAELVTVGEVSPRSGCRAVGEYQLRAADVRGLRRFPDAACQSGWPIEWWDPVKGVSLEYLPDSGAYDIPMRSLKVAGIDNVWAAGKCISAESIAQASLRVAGCCWATGQAAGTAAACTTRG